MPGLAASATTFTRSVGGEAIDHHPVEPDQRANLARAFLKKLAESGHWSSRVIIDRTMPVASPCSPEAGSASITTLPAGEMHRHVERLGARHDLESSSRSTASGPRAHRGAVARFMDSPCPERSRAAACRSCPCGDRPIKLGDVGGDARDDPVGGQRDQEPDRLDRAEDVDRLAIAIGEIDPFEQHHSKLNAPRKYRPPGAGSMAMPETALITIDRAAP